MQLIPDYQPQGEEMNKQILTARYWLAPSSGCHLVGEPETEKRTHDFPSSMDTPLTLTDQFYLF